MFTLIRNCQTVFQSGCSILYAPRVVSLPTFSIVSLFLILGIPVGIMKSLRHGNDLGF